MYDIFEAAVDTTYSVEAVNMNNIYYTTMEMSLKLVTFLL